VTWEEYEADLDRNLARLHARVHSGSYRATPSRRVYIPKPDGGRRPLAVAALEDKVVQRAVVGVLNAILQKPRVAPVSESLTSATLETRGPAVTSGV